MATFEEGSPGKIALDLIKSSGEQLGLGTNEGDQAFHRLIEDFETMMEAKLADCDTFSVHHVAICLTSAYRRAIDKDDELAADELGTHLRAVAIRLCEVNSALLGALRSGGQLGKLLAECARTGDPSSRVCL